MLERIVNLYVFLFARKRFHKFNRLLLRLSLGGLGVLNYKTSSVSGEHAFLKSYLPEKKGIILDIGANKGAYTLEALQINPEMTIYAFEPHPLTFSKLSKNLAEHQGAYAVNQGLSSASGILKLYDYANKDGSSHASLFKDVITEIHGATSAVEHDIELTTIDKFVEKTKISEITLLKIDTEGNELEVLKGGLSSLSQGKIKAIHFEFNEMNVESRAFFRDFWKLLDQYRFYRMLPNELLEIKRYNPLTCELFAFQNIVAILQD